jgi:hypothetical protein
MNYSEDSRIDEFCRELALALRRITGLTPDSLPDDLAMQAEVLSSPREDDDADDDGDNGNDEEGDDDGEYDDEHIS